MKLEQSSLLFYSNNKDYIKLEPKEIKDVNVIVGQRSKEDVIKRTSVPYNTFLSALFYGPESLQNLNKNNFIIERTKSLFNSCFEKEMVKDLKTLSNLLGSCIKNYEDNLKEDKDVRKSVMLNMLKEEDILSYIEGSIAEEETLSINELKELIESIYQEILEQYLKKIKEEKAYKAETIRKFKKEVGEEFTCFISNFYSKQLQTYIVTDDEYDFNDLDYNMTLYKELMKKDETLPNVIIINAETMSLFHERKDVNFDPDRKTVSLFYFPSCNQFERILYETFCCPSVHHKEGYDYTTKRRNKEEYYRCYSFDSDHEFILHFMGNLKGKEV